MIINWNIFIYNFHIISIYFIIIYIVIKSIQLFHFEKWIGLHFQFFEKHIFERLSTIYCIHNTIFRTKSLLQYVIYNIIKRKLPQNSKNEKKQKNNQKTTNKTTNK